MKLRGLFLIGLFAFLSLMMVHEGVASYIENSQVTVVHADTSLFISNPEIYWDPDSSDRYEAVHPSVVYFEDGWNGYKYWLAMTPYDASSPDHENPCIRVSNDNETWQIFSTGLDENCPDPVYRRQEVIWDDSPIRPEGDTATHLSDVKLLFGPDDRMWLYFRATWYYGFDSSLQHSAICVTSTSDGINWTDWQFAVRPTNMSSLLSPAVIRNENGSYSMWAVNSLAPDGTIRPEGPYRVDRYVSHAPDTGWEYAGEVDWRPFDGDWSGEAAIFADQHEIWHIDVIPINKWELVALVTLQPHYDLFLSVSYNGGLTWHTKFDPILEGSKIVGTFNRSLYKSCGIWLPTAEGAPPVMGLYYGTWSELAPDGMAYTEGEFQISADFDCGDFNGDGIGADIVDLTYIVGYMFGGGPPPVFYRAADLVGNNTDPDIVDLARLVDYLFGSVSNLNCP